MKYINKVLHVLTVIREQAVHTDRQFRLAVSSCLSSRMRLNGRKRCYRSVDWVDNINNNELLISIIVSV